MDKACVEDHADSDDSSRTCNRLIEPHSSSTLLASALSEAAVAGAPFALCLRIASSTAESSFCMRVRHRSSRATWQQQGEASGGVRWNR